MADDLTLDPTIRSFYDAATGQGSWDGSFDLLAAASGFVGIAFYVFEHESRALLDRRWRRLNPDSAEGYARTYMAIDPRGALLFKPNPPRIRYDYLHTAEEEIDRDPFYAWYQREQRMRYYVGGHVRTDDGLAVSLTLHRPRASGHAQRGELCRFARLFDHFQHAVMLQRRIALDARLPDGGYAAVERQAEGVVVLDRLGRLLHANAAARRIAARNDALRLEADGLRAIRRFDADRLNALLRAALASFGAPEPLRLARREGGRDYVVTVYPTPQGDLLIGHDRPAAVVRIFDPDAEAAEGLAEFARLFGLTRREAAVLRLLLDGRDGAAIAGALGLKPASVRTYLAAVFRKTGARRQSDLVALAKSLCGFVAH